MTLWVRQLDDCTWSWGRDDQLVGHIAVSELGGIEPVDARDDLDLVTALLMARNGLTSFSPDDVARTASEPMPQRPSTTWRRSTSGSAKGTGHGPTLKDRANRRTTN